MKFKNIHYALVFVLITSLAYSQNYYETRKFKFKGKVVDKVTKAPLEDVNISIGPLRGTISDNKGEFELNLTLGYYKVRFSRLNYETFTFEINKKEESDYEAIIELNPKLIELKPVEVKSEKLDYPEIKKFEIKRKDLTYIPAVLEKDIIRSAALLPGVATANDFSSQLFIWGGNFDKTLITIDNIPVWNPYHFAGMFSFISSDAVEKVTVFPAAYSVTFPDYIAGIINIMTRKTQSENFEFNCNLSLLSSSLTLNGPIGSENSDYSSSFSLNARRVYYDLIVNLAGEDAPYYFYDFVGSYSFIAKNVKLNATLYYSKDCFDIFKKGEIKEQPNWGNFGIGINGSLLLDSENNFDISLYYANSFTNANYLRQDVIKKIFTKNNLSDVALMAKWNWNIEKNFLLSSGANIQRIEFDYKWDNYGGSLWTEFNPEEGSLSDNFDYFFDHASNTFFYKKTLWKNSFFLESRYDFNSISILSGIKTVHVESLKNFYLSENASVMYNFDENMSMRFGMGSYNQFYRTIKNRSNSLFFAPFAVYLPADFPEKSKHFNLSLKYEKDNYRIQFDYYVKFFNDLKFSVLDERLYVYGKGKSYGINIDFDQDFRWIKWNVLYSLNFARSKIDNLWRPAYFEQRHNLKILTYLRLSKKWELSAFWNIGSGMPYTPIKGAIFSPDLGKGGVTWFSYRLIYGYENSKNLPWYSRLDVKFNGNYIWGKFRMKPFVQVFNVLNNKRVIGYRYDSVLGIIPKTYGSFIIPSFGIEFYGEL